MVTITLWIWSGTREDNKGYNYVENYYKFATLQGLILINTKLLMLGFLLPQHDRLVELPPVPSHLAGHGPGDHTAAPAHDRQAPAAPHWPVVCISVCMCSNMYIYVSVCACVCNYVVMYMCLFAYVCICMYNCTCMLVCTCKCDKSVSVCMCLWLYVFVYVCMCMYVCAYICCLACMLC